MNPQKFLTEILQPNGIMLDDFVEYDGLYQTLNPCFFEIALNKSLQNLGLETIDVHYVHIPEITRSGLSEETFYDRMEELFCWYEGKVKEGKIRYYGIALEFLVEEPDEKKWHFQIEKLKIRADKAAAGDSHFKYVLFTYNLLCPYASTIANQEVSGRRLTVVEACKELGLETVGSMPFAMGDGFEKYTIKETTLYSAFTRMEKNGYVESFNDADTANGKRRTYYRITELGKQYYNEKCEEWIVTKDVVEKFIKEQ